MDLTEPDAAADRAAPEGSRKRYDAFISYAHAADDAFAPVLQRGLQHLAKPWNRRRAMEVFRDESSLAVSPGLWRSITAALDASRWFILLASPEAARSHWVGEEIKYWVSNKGADHLLVVVTDGTWTWDTDTGDLSPASTAANPALRGVFPAEPLYLDMTWARRDAGLTLRNAKFRDQIATLAATIQDVPKEEIEGEDVRQERRTHRIVRAVIATLTVLVLLASVLAVVANSQRQQADRELAAATSGELIAKSNELGDTNPVLAKLDSLAAWRIDPTNQARYAMLTAARLPGIDVLTAATAPRSMRWRSARTARPWPPPAATAPSGWWTWSPASRSARPLPAAPVRSIRWRSARTGKPWPPAPLTAPCSCGTWPPAGKSASRWPAARARFSRWRSARTGRPWPSATPRRHRPAVERGHPSADRRSPHRSP